MSMEQDKKLIAQKLIELYKNNQNQNKKLDDIEDNTNEEPKKVKDPLRNFKAIQKGFGSHNRLNS